MSGNKNLNQAMKARQDEFYTQKDDIEAELWHYKKHFKDKVVYCNCDDPCDGSMASEFWKFFMRNFSDWGLKKLIATHYEPDEKIFSYKIEAGADKNGQFNFNGKPQRRKINSNGDFRSASCIRLLKQSDIVVTNPPFSLFREYVAQLMKYNKKFVIIGPRNAITYKEIFPLISANKIWLGHGFKNSDAYFRIDEKNAAKYAAGVYNPETGLVHFRNCTWFTNLDITKRHEPIDLRGNYYYGNEGKYPKYDNYDAIEVSRTENIPIDYMGVMGVPITFMDKYCPEQFEIIGLDRYTVPKEFLVGGRVAINGKAKFARILIRRRESAGGGE